MDNDTTPAAPAPAPEADASVASTNTNSNTDAPAPQVSPKAEIPADQVEAWNRFMENNGGFEKAFQKVKDAIAKPQSAPTDSQVPAQPTQPVGPQPTADQNIVTASPGIPQMEKPAEGYLSANDIAKLQYNKMLSEAYSELDTEGYITKGEFVKEATSMGIPVMDQAGNMNDAAIRKFLDLKKATIPPAPTSAPITATPTVTYTTVEGDITTQEQADKIILEGANNPQYQDALKFTRERIFGKVPEPKQK